MNLSVGINHRGIIKKVTINKNKTIGDLIKIACVKFDILNGDLYYQSSKLSPLDLIKHTKLVNNCRLQLTMAKVDDVEINVKLIGPTGDTHIHKLSNHLILSDIIHNLDVPESGFVVNLLNKLIKAEDCNVRLYELIGGASNVVIRVSKVKGVSQEQQDVLKQELRLLDLKKQKAREKKEMEDEKRQELIRASKNNQESQPMISKPNEVVEMPISQLGPEVTSENSEIEQPQTQQSHIVDQNDTIYEPTRVEKYENPDSDYEFTVNHAKIYQNTIKYKPKTSKKPMKIPQLYHLRIKFPNNYLLEFHLNRGAKFGELVKKIDTHLLPNAQSNYGLKLSYPPFTKFPILFELNQKSLVDLNIAEKEVLIWESTEEKYLIMDNVKSFNSLPEVQLDQMRDDLPDPSPHESDIVGGSSKPSAITKKGPPKWLKFGK